MIIAIFALLALSGVTYFYLNNGTIESVKMDTKNPEIAHLTVTSNQSTTKDIYYTTQPYTAIRANVGNMSVWAELYFDKYNTYVGICDSKNARVKAEGIDKFWESTLRIVSPTDVYCNASSNSFVYSLHMPDGNSWCADSQNKIGGVINTKVNTLSCK